MRSETLEHGTLEHWTPEEVAAALAKGEIVLIDVRTPQEYMFEHVEAALLKPMAFFDPAHLPSEGGASGAGKRIVFHCGSGARSSKMAKMYLQAGHDRTAHMDGGFGAWKTAGLPYVGTDMSTGAPKRMPA